MGINNQKKNTYKHSKDYYAPFILQRYISKKSQEYCINNLLIN